MTPTIIASIIDRVDVYPGSPSRNNLYTDPINKKIIIPPKNKTIMVNPSEAGKKVSCKIINEVEIIEKKM